MKKIILPLLLVIVMIACTKKEIELVLREDNSILLRNQRNNDITIREKLFLTVEDVKNVQQLVRTIYPYFRFDREDGTEEFRFKTDDASIEQFVKNFNLNGPNFCAIWVLGSEEYTGYSGVQSWLNGIIDIDETRLWSYHFYFVEHFSDRSGIWFSDFPAGTRDSNTLRLWRRNYANSHDYFWEVYWLINLLDEGFEFVFTPEEKMEILMSFLKEIRSTIVFQNIDKDWFAQIYTGIEGNRQTMFRELLEKIDF